MSKRVYELGCGSCISMQRAGFHTQTHPSMVTSNFKKPRWRLERFSTQAFEITLLKPLGDTTVATVTFIFFYLQSIDMAPHIKNNSLELQRLLTGSLLNQKLLLYRVRCLHIQWVKQKSGRLQDEMFQTKGCLLLFTVWRYSGYYCNKY